MDITIENLGEFGLNADRSSAGLPLNVWSDIQNGRCEDGGIGPGVSWALYNGSVPNTAATWLMFARRAGLPYLFIAGDNSVYLFDGSTYTQVNQTIPGAPLQGRWSGVFDGEIPYLNHISDAPQYADFPSAGWPGSPTLQDLMYNVNGTAGNQTFRELSYRVGVLRAHKGFLFAGNWIKGGTNRPSLLAWDNPTASNIVSDNWVPGPTSLAGEFDCVDSGRSGVILDMLPLRDDMVVYKEDSAWIAKSTGGAIPAWGLKKLIGIPGIIAQDCVIEEKGRHYVWGPEDIYVHQGQNAESVINNRVRKSFINQIDGDNYLNCFAVKNVEKKEIWFCGPTQGNTYPDRALVYQWIDGTFTITELPQPAFMTEDTRIEAALRYQDATMPYAQASFSYGQRNFSPLDKAIIGVMRDDQDLLQFDLGNTRYIGGSDQAFFTRFERTNMAFNGFKGQTVLNEFWPDVNGTGTLSIYAGRQERPNGPVTWEGPRSFVIGTDKVVKFRAKGKLNCIRIDAQTGTDWRMDNVLLVVNAAGRRG